jgi:two-component system chemotaxis response regulator CheY
MTRLCSSTASDTGRRALQILIVNDDATQRSLISLAAKQAGHAVIMAATNADAIRVVRHVQFDCVTLDVMLDDGDGDVTKVLKAIVETEFRGPPVIISGMDAPRRIAAHVSMRGRWVSG